MVILKRILPRRAWVTLRLVFTHLVFIAVVGPFAFIFVYMFWNSVKPNFLFYEPGTWFFPPTWRNYQEVFASTEVLQNIWNSVIVSSFATAIGLICGLMTAYTIARYNLRRLAVAILVTRMIPYITALIPFWVMYTWAGLINTYTGLVFSHLVITIPFGVWILIGFIEDIPRELEESALIDGCNHMGAFLRVVIPLTVPGLVAAAILCFIFSWNNFQFALVLGGLDVQTAPVAVFKFAAAEAGGKGQMMAAATLVTLPVFVIVMFIQKQMAAGLTIGGISK